MTDKIKNKSNKDFEIERKQQNQNPPLLSRNYSHYRFIFK